MAYLILADMGIARLMVIDLEPRHLLEVLDVAVPQEPGTPQWNRTVVPLLFSGRRVSQVGRRVRRDAQAEDVVVDVLHQAENFTKSPDFPKINLT